MSMFLQNVAGYTQRIDLVTANIAKVIRGKDEVIRLALLGLLAGGHLLIEDVPGVGKTTLARAMAASLELSLNRIQFTPDLLPSDVTGVTIYNQRNGDFEFRPGPIFANLVLADEINRASPKTQAALLEVMEEGTVTTDGQVYPVPQPFMVIATQNPIDMEGTYQLPEAQVDRFLMRLSVGYPDQAEEMQMLRNEKSGASVGNLSQVLSEHELLQLLVLTKSIEVSPAMEGYVVDLVSRTRVAGEVRLGVSPRGALALVKVARAHAGADGRSFVVPEDVKAVAHAVLDHRLILRPEAMLAGRSASEVVDRILGEAPVPRSVDAAS